MSVRKVGSFKFGLTKKIFLSQKRRLPIVLGNIAKNFFLEAFRKGGFTDVGFKRWKQRRKRLGRGRTSPTLKEAATLVQSGKVKRSIRVRPATFRITRIFTNVVYAAIHNFGLQGLAFGKASFKMPEREFMGKSKVLERKLERRILKEIDKAF